MAYTQQLDGTILINGFENGIADDPYSGIADMKNVNIISIPKEGSVNFSTKVVSAPQVSGNMTTYLLNNTISTGTAPLDTGMCIRFSVLSDTTKGLSLNTNYWLQLSSAGFYEVYSNVKRTTRVNITGDGVTGTYATVNIAQPRAGTKDNADYYWMIDSLGQVWSNVIVTVTNGYWVYMGNNGGTGLWGNPNIAFYAASDGTGYIFTFRNDRIDYTKSAIANISWVYGWNTATGGSGAVSMKTASGDNNSHQNILAPDNRLYFCDGNWIGRFYQLSPTVAFDPTNTATYSYDEISLLPYNDSSVCLAYLGTNLLIGGRRNVIYPWDRFSTNVSYQILIAENYISQMLTINTNTYILAGNRGRIYITNGSQASLLKKIPDHISGTVEPYYTWGGLASIKNQLYFSASVTTNSGSAISGYGGVWAIDMDTRAMRLTNKLSYGTYLGYAPVILAQVPYTNLTNPSGIGLFIGWDSGASTYGIDATIGTPYTAGESVIDSDLIPIGTVLKPTTNGSVEFKLSRPLVAGESIALQYRQIFNNSDTGFQSITTAYGTTSFSTAGIYSGVYQNVNFQKSQWLQIRAVLTSTASSPSYVRLTEIRLK